MHHLPFQCTARAHTGAGVTPGGSWHQGRIQAFFIGGAHGGPTVTLGWLKFLGGFKPHSTPEMHSKLHFGTVVPNL